MKKIIISLLVLLATFAAGRYSNDQANVKTVTQTNTETQEAEHKNVHEVEVITKSPTGAVTETITTDTSTQVQTAVQSSSKTATVTAPPPSINISALVGTSIHSFGTPVYGLSAQKELLGPVIIGAFGLTNGTVGVSIGLNF